MPMSTNDAAGDRAKAPATAPADEAPPDAGARALVVYQPPAPPLPVEPPGPPAVTERELVPVHTEPLPRDRNPAAVYLAGKPSAAGRRGLHNALRRATLVLTGGISKDPYAVDWPAVRYQHVAALRAVLIEQGARPASVNLVLSAIRGTMKDAWRLGQIDAEHLARVTDVPNVKSEQLAAGRHVEAGEIRRLFEECGHDPVGARDAAMLGLLYGCGLRRSEAVALELADYDDGAVKVRAGKGRKERFVYAATGARAAVEAWIAVRGSWDGALLAPVTKGGHVQRRPLSAQAVMLRLRFLAERAKISRLSPHDLRRSFVGELLEAGADMSMVQKLAGHADPATTARYDRRPEDAKRRTAGLLHVPYVAAPLLPVSDAPADAGDESPPAASPAPPGRGDPPPAAAPG